VPFKQNHMEIFELQQVRSQFDTPVTTDPGNFGPPAVRTFCHSFNLHQQAAACKPSKW